MLRDGALGRNPEITVEGWYMLINALYHSIEDDTFWDNWHEVKDIALGYKER